MANLLLINGPPGVGKSTIARRYVDDHPMSLHLEIYSIRLSLGGWQEHDESKRIARELALAMAERHLRAGHDVVVAQYLGRIEFIEALDQLTRTVGADFIEVMLLDTEPAVTERFRARRTALAELGQAHPQLDIDDEAIPETIAASFDRLESVRSARSRTHVIDLANDVEEAYRALRVATSA